MKTDLNDIRIEMTEGFVTSNVYRILRDRYPSFEQVSEEMINLFSAYVEMAEQVIQVYGDNEAQVEQVEPKPFR